MRLVARFEPVGSTPSRFFAFSFAVHVGLAIVILLIPGPKRTPIGPSIAVSLTAAPPAPQATVKAPVPKKPAVKPKPPEPKPEGVALETKPVEPDPDPPPREPEPEPVPDDAPGDTGESDAEAADGELDDDGGGGVPGGEAGDDIASLDLLGSEFGWYTSQVTSALRSNWIRPPLGNVRQPLTVVVSFEIQRDGRVRRETIEESSGVPSLDRSALRAVLDASPLPALPRGIDAPTVPARFVFRWFPDED